MHGTKTYLPNKWKFMAKAVPTLQADIIAFQFRGYGQSDGEKPTE